MKDEKMAPSKGSFVSDWKARVARLLRVPRLLARATLLSVCAVGIGLQPFAVAEESQFLTGQLLVATPEMGDPRFVETVIYMVSHNEEGAMGLVVNRPVATGPISDLLKWFGVESEGATGEITLHYGGPVEPEKGSVLHSDDYVRDGTVVVRDGLAVTSDVEVLRAISRGEGPQRSLAILGYAGWAPGQLKAEIRANAWFTISAEEALIFDGNAKTKWERARAKRKIRT